MRKIPVLLLAICGLAACASPTFNMTDDQIRALGDDQLCHYHNSYRAEARAEAEIAARGLNCDRYYRECLRRGNAPQTEAMAFCMDVLRENDRLRRENDYYEFNRMHRMGVYTGVGIGF